MQQHEVQNKQYTVYTQVQFTSSRHITSPPLQWWWHGGIHYLLWYILPLIKEDQSLCIVVLTLGAPPRLLAVLVVQHTLWFCHCLWRQLAIFVLILLSPDPCPGAAIMVSILVDKWIWPPTISVSAEWWRASAQGSMLTLAHDMMLCRKWHGTTTCFWWPHLDSRQYSTQSTQ